MEYIIAILNDETETKYVHWLNGFAPPTLTTDFMKAKRFNQDEAEKHAEKIRQQARKEGSETTSVEVIEFIEEPTEKPPSEPVKEEPTEDPPAEPVKEEPVKSKHYIEGWGEPHGRFEFGEKEIKFAYYLYMKKDSEGKLMYGYTDRNGVFLAISQRPDGPNGQEVFTAFVKSALNEGIELIRKFEERNI